MIINDKGQLVWFKPTPGKIPADFRVQTYYGKPVLTWWEGQLFVGDGDGVGAGLRHQTTSQIATVHAGNGYSFDLHEFTITPRNTALVLAYERYKRDLRPWGGPKRRARSSTTSSRRSTSRPALVLFEWHSFGNVSPTESYIAGADRAPASSGSTSTSTRPRSTPDGNFLISARNTLGDLQDQPRHRQDHVAPGRQEVRPSSSARACASTGSTAPARSPTARSRSTTTRPRRRSRKTSRALTLKLDEQAKTATLVQRASSTRASLLSASQGNVETLPNGNRSSAGARSAGSPSSTPTGQGRLRRPPRPRQRQLPRVPLPVDRARRRRRRRSSPTTDERQHTARVSWNGATEVARWQLLARRGRSDAGAVASSPRRRASRPRSRLHAPGACSSRCAPQTRRATCLVATEARRSALERGALGGQLAAGRVDVAAARQAARSRAGRAPRARP